jgi:ribosomal protein S18 acetylase RimI-like enzyme
VIARGITTGRSRRDSRYAWAALLSPDTLDSMPTTIQRAGRADIPALVELMRQFYAESNYALERKWAEASFDALLRDELRGAVWIARRGPELAGYVVLALRHSMEFGGLAGIIDDLFVPPQFRRQRVGSALLSALLEACRTLHVAAVHVEVGPNNLGALALYQAFGLRGYSVERQTLTVELGAEEHAV